MKKLKYIEYTVKEKAVKEYETTVEEGTINITNTHKPEEQDIKVEKIWDDANDQDGKRPDSIKVQLKANEKRVGQTVVLNEENNWKFDWTNLPVYDNGNKIEYTINEEDIPKGYTSKVERDKDDNFKVTNSHTPELIEISGKKVWNDKDNQDGIRPDSIKVNLLADGKVIQSKTVNSDSNWEYIFKDLSKYKDKGKLIEYTIDEVKVDGYETEIDGHNITNTHKPEVISLSVNKVWKDSNNKAGKRPSSIKVQLYANGKESGSEITLNESNNWSYNWKDLDVNANGNKVIYEVKEVDVPRGYTSTVVEKEGRVTVTNTYTPNTPNVPGTPNKPKKPKGFLPKTGENTNVILLVIGIMLTAFAGYLVKFRSKKED